MIRANWSRQALTSRCASASRVDIFLDWNGERFPLNLQFPSRRQQPAKVRAFVDFLAATVR
jgi:DNA-binding transcriptional LysR family regulator